MMSSAAANLKLLLFPFGAAVEILRFFLSVSVVSDIGLYVYGIDVLNSRLSLCNLIGSTRVSFIPLLIPF
jgi:hypothetical protein